MMLHGRYNAQTGGNDVVDSSEFGEKRNYKWRLGNIVADNVSQFESILSCIKSVLNWILVDDDVLVVKTIFIVVEIRTYL